VVFISIVFDILVQFQNSVQVEQEFSVVVINKDYWVA